MSMSTGVLLSFSLSWRTKFQITGHLCRAPRRQTFLAVTDGLEFVSIFAGLDQETGTLLVFRAT